MRTAELYDRDFYLWTVRNAELLAAGEYDKADIEHIAEEIRDMGTSERQELFSRLKLLITHLLKWQFQPEHQSRSWRVTIMNQRFDIEDMLERMPSLRRDLQDSLAKAYRRAVRTASIETGIPQKQFPKVCPFSLSKILDSRFLPE